MSQWWGAFENGRHKEMTRTILAAATLLLVAISTASAGDFDKKLAEARAQVATKFFDPGPTIVMKVVQETGYSIEPDLGLNLTSLTT